MSRRALWMVCGGALALSGCKVGPNFTPPEPPQTRTYAADGDAPPPADQHIALGARIEGDWWTQFHSAALDALIEGRPVSADQRPSIGCNIKWRE